MENAQITATKLIAQLFVNHGVEVAQQGNIIDFIHKNMNMQVNCFLHDHDNQSQSIQLDVVLHYGIKPIIESFSGLGDDKMAMVENAVQNFIVSTFHILLSVFFSDEFDNQVEKERWQIGGRQFEMTIGDFVSRGEVPKTLGTAWFDEYQKEVQKLPLSDGVHWLRLYYGQADKQAIAYEALLDNEHCQEIMPLVENFSWQPSENFYSIRVFLVAKHGVDFGRVAYLIANADELHQAIESLKQLGLSELEAQKAVVFIPEAFGMVLMKQIGVQGDFPTKAQAINDNNQSIELDLNQETIFQEALHLAQSLWEQGYQESVQQLALIGAGIKILDRFLADDDSHQPEQLHFDNIATLFYISGLTAPTTAQPILETKKSKPFWKFW